MRDDTRPSGGADRWWSALVLLGGLGLAFGCQQAEADASTGEAQPSAERAAMPAAQAPTPVPEAAKASVSDEAFDIELKPLGDYEAKKAAELSLVLVAKGPYKINDEYPYKFKLEPTKGVSFPSELVGAEHLKLEKKRAVMTIPFTPESSGKKKISGLFKFSVCTAERCLVERRNLALDVDVK